MPAQRPVHLTSLAQLLALLAAGCAAPHTMTTMAPEPGCPALAAADWAGPSQQADRAKLDSWCQTVGPSVVLELARPSQTLLTGDSLAIVAWNVQGRAGNIPLLLQENFGISCDGSEPASLAVVLLIQEAVRAGDQVPGLPPTARPVPKAIAVPDGLERADDIVATARRCGLSLVYLPSMRNGAEGLDGVREDKGNAILANVPLLEIAGIELPWETQRRVAVSAEIRPGQAPIRVTSFHLDVSPGLWRIMKTGNSSRLRQALGLTEGLSLVAGDDESIVIGGDLNTWSGNQTVIQRLAELFPDSPEWDGKSTRGEFPADHIFFRRGNGGTAWEVGGYHRVEQLYRSDHNPRILWLRMARANSGN